MHFPLGEESLLKINSKTIFKPSLEKVVRFPVDQYSGIPPPPIYKAEAVSNTHSFLRTNVSH